MSLQFKLEELKKVIATGEKIDIEFKKSRNDLNRDLYETVCAFNNRDGGHIFLGIVDKTKEICGVNPDRIDKMKKDFTTAINNPNKINPPMYLVPEEYEIDGKMILYIHVPEGTQVRRLNGRIFDRTYERDIDITDNAELVYKMYGRKQNTYFVNKVYPNFGLGFLDFDVIKRATHGHGELQLNRFKAFSKNPAISKIFREIGYADELGSGMRNTNKYTKLYSGGNPIFVEDNIFQITIPIDHVANLKVGSTGGEIITKNVVDYQKMSDKANDKMSDKVSEQASYQASDKMSDKMSDKVSDKLKAKEKVFLEILISQLEEEKYVTTTGLSNITSIPKPTIRRYMKKFCELGILVSQGKNKSTQYRLKKN